MCPVASMSSLKCSYSFPEQTAATFPLKIIRYIYNKLFQAVLFVTFNSSNFLVSLARLKDIQHCPSQQGVPSTLNKILMQQTTLACTVVACQGSTPQLHIIRLFLSEIFLHWEYSLSVPFTRLVSTNSRTPTSHLILHDNNLSDHKIPWTHKSR